ncbi:hypothetical protein BDB00DRAFT_35100 [Zychaea mexicana]|uniref:uncharacterized protein n=1 Tax=Zychaea mexicana TaxID=64656 RepID=UPI0022FEC75A|nr:uncharacterized protein BDB00DRAFT_35100 [Zychaea mexicana]KAI9488667.1 hypothetical protein BDB00DRAFT_35100 [Zychaea mexicana]
MYFIYKTKQYSDHHKGPISLAQYNQPPRQFFSLPRPEFMPSLLVRTSDMQVVQGSMVHEGYCALSYSWSWSGDLIQDKTSGITKRVDRGKHKIVFPARSIRQHPRGRKRIPAKSKHVQFEGIIQQICKDFNIKYIWYDQMCINQDDKEEKYREIHRMHQIYTNAYCTVALVPEFHADDGGMGRDFVFPKFASITQSEWYKRLWTLEEAFMSQRLLFVGRNVHSWWYSAANVQELSSMCNSSGEARQWNVSTILHYAHKRASSNEYDRVFALANLFPDIMDEITISYDQPLELLLLQFYCLLAKKDISILFFGANENGPGDSTASFRKLKELLPSWTGIDVNYHRGIPVTGNKAHCSLQ